MRTATTMSLLLLTGMLMLASPAGAQTSALTDAASELQPTWFNPQNPQPGEVYPLAITLKSDAVPEAAAKWWLSTLYTSNFCQCVVTNPAGDWSDVSINDVLALVDPLPGNVPANGERLVLIADENTAPLARRMIDAFPERIAGAVMVSARALTITRTGQATVWPPRKEARAVPLWVVIGTTPGPAATVLKTWRQFESLSPPNAPLTIDARLGRGLDYILPDKAITDWLAAIRDGKTPPPGPDAQALQAHRRYAMTTQAVGDLLQQRGFASPAGQRISKADGPMTVSVMPPQGWARSREREKPYNPTGTTTDESGMKIDAPPNPFLQIGLTPDIQSPRYALAMATPWKRSAADLIAYANKRLTSRGYIAFPLEQWTADGWVIELTAFAFVHNESWGWWVSLSAARKPEAGNVAAPMIMVLSRAEEPDPRTLVAVLNRLRQTVQIDWTGPPPRDETLRIED